MAYRVETANPPFLESIGGGHYLRGPILSIAKTKEKQAFLQRNTARKNRGVPHARWDASISLLDSRDSPLTPVRQF